MLIKRIEGCTRVFGAPPDWESSEVPCGALPVRDIETSEGSYMVSAWEPSPGELAALQRGETLKLWVRGSQHPVVAFTVGPLE